MCYYITLGYTYVLIKLNFLEYTDIDIVFFFKFYLKKLSDFLIFAYIVFKILEVMSIRLI